MHVLIIDRWPFTLPARTHQTISTLGDKICQIDTCSAVFLSDPRLAVRTHAARPTSGSPAVMLWTSPAKRVVRVIAHRPRTLAYSPAIKLSKLLIRLSLLANSSWDHSLRLIIRNPMIVRFVEPNHRLVDGDSRRLAPYAFLATPPVYLAVCFPVLVESYTSHDKNMCVPTRWTCYINITWKEIKKTVICSCNMQLAPHRQTEINRNTSIEIEAMDVEMKIGVARFHRLR